MILPCRAQDKHAAAARTSASRERTASLLALSRTHATAPLETRQRQTGSSQARCVSRHSAPTQVGNWASAWPMASRGTAQQPAALDAQPSTTRWASAGSATAIIPRSARTSAARPGWGRNFRTTPLCAVVGKPQHQRLLAGFACFADLGFLGRLPPRDEASPGLVHGGF